MLRKIIQARGATLPVSLEDAKRNLDITSEDDNTLITGLIKQAVGTVESRTNLLLYPATVLIVTDELLAPVSLPTYPTRSLTSVTRAGAALDGVATFPGSPYTVLLPAGLYGLFPGDPAGRVEITVEAGYAEGECPEALVGAIHAVIRIAYDQPIGYDLDRAWEAVDRIIQPLRMPA